MSGVGRRKERAGGEKVRIRHVPCLGAVRCDFSLSTPRADTDWSIPLSQRYFGSTYTSPHLNTTPYMSSERSSSRGRGLVRLSPYLEQVVIPLLIFMLAHSNPPAVVAQATFVPRPEAMKLKALVPKIIRTPAAETLSLRAIPARYVSASVSDPHAFIENCEFR